MKRRLVLEELPVESFDTSPERKELLGTVRGYALDTGGVTCPALTCAEGCSGAPVATCDSSCMTAPCAYTSPMPGCQSGFPSECCLPIEP